jgi:hypothetical protein
VVSSLNQLRAAIFAALAVITTASLASADEVDRCVAASERGQKERRAGNLMEARTAFLQCAAEKCPHVVKTACAEWGEQVNAALPSIIVAVTDSEKRDIVDAKISVDGKPVVLGRVVQLDPGPHTIAVEADGFQSATQAIVARETERNRAVHVTLGPKGAVTKTPEPPPPPAESSSIRPITWITGGLALVALGGFGFFGVRGRVQAADLRDTCAPDCTADQRSTVKTTYVIADVSLIAAVLLGGVSMYTFLTRDSKP